MTNDDTLTEAIRLIKAGNKDEAQLVLEPFLLNNPNHIQAWLWEAELFPNDRDKIKVLEACLKQNPGHPQVIQALTFLKKRSELNKQPATPTPSSPPFSVPPTKKPSPSSSSPFSEPPSATAAPSSSPFLTSPFLPDPVVPVSASQQTTADSPVVENLARPEPLPPKAQRLQKKSNRMTPKIKNAIITIILCIILFAVMGLYLGGGFYLNGQINKSFAGQNCAGVVQYASFVSLYPKGIFASIFTGYGQYAECRIKLDVEQAVAVKNWQRALSRAQEYLATYPTGPFAESISDQAPNILSTWSGELIANRDYGNGIEKLKQLVEDYPDSPPAQLAPDAILQTYILWTKELTGNQNYAEAEQRLNAALSYFQADPARSDQIKQELINLYVDWGDMQIQLGDMENGVKYYKKAGEISPEQIDVELLIAHADLQKAIDMGDSGNFDRALTKVKEISDGTQAENIKSEANAAQEKILAAYSVSTSQQAIDQMAAAISLTCQGQRPQLPIFGLDAEKIRFGLTNFYIKLPMDRAAERPSELHYVICINDKEEDEIETCPYTGGFFLSRMRYVWQITLYDILNGNEYESKTFKGSAPEECPPRANFQIGSKVSKSFGKRPTVDEIVAWLDKLNITK
jgi:tetratricopeptide (TPR) repeat protein